MKRKTRRILLFISIAAFLILSILVILYAMGYEYDFVQNKFLKTGSFELKTNVSADVYINDNFAGDTSFFGNYFSKGNLLPHVYALRVESDGYQAWQKLVKVEGGLVDSFPKVVLLPKDLSEDTVASSSIKTITIKQIEPEQNLAIIGNKQTIDAFNLSDGSKKTYKQPFPIPIILQKTDISAGIDSPDGGKKLIYDSHQISVEWTKDAGYQPFEKTGDSAVIIRFPQTITDVQWYADSEHLIANVGGILKFIEIDNRDGINVFDIATVDGPFYYDKDQDVIYKFDGNKLVKITLAG